MEGEPEHSHRAASATDGEEHGGGRLVTTSQVTLHCLAGCMIGEVAGLLIGVSIGLGAWVTMGLATALALVSGMTLAVLPLMRGQGMTLRRALATVWLGEVASILVMEVAMNATDYWVGGVTAAGPLEPIFWLGMLAAVPAGFVAAWPVNYLLIGASLKTCH